MIQPRPSLLRTATAWAVMFSAVAVGLVLAYLQFDFVGERLAMLQGWQRVAMGGLLGAVTAAPSLLLVRQRVRPGTVAVVLWWLLAFAFFWLAPFPFTCGGLPGELPFRQQAGSYVATSTVAFFGIAVVMLRRAPVELTRPLWERLRLSGRRP